MKRNKFTRLTALVMAIFMVLVLGGCSSGRTMSTDSPTTESNSSDDWDTYFNGDGSTVITGNPNASNGNGSGKNNNSNNDNKGNSNQGSGDTIADNTNDVVIKSEEFPWPDYKFKKGDTITLLSIGVDQNSYPIQQQLLEEKYGLKVDFVSSDFFGLESKFQQMDAAGNTPDLVNYKCYSHSYYAMILKGMLSDVSKYIDTTDKDLWGTLTSAYKQSKYNGKNYFLFSTMSKGPYVFYNKKMFREAGVGDLWETYKSNPSKWDWNKLKEIGVKLTDKSAGVVGLVTDDGGSFFHTTGQLYGQWGTTRATTKINMKNQAFARAAEFITQGRTDGWINTAVQTTTEVFADEVAAMAFALTDVSNEWKDIASRGDLGIVPMPKDPEANKLWNFKHLSGFVIPAKAKNPKGAVAFALCHRYYYSTDAGLTQQEQKYKEMGLTDLNIEQLYEPDKAGSPVVDMAQNLGYTNVWNCLLHKHPWSSTFTGETQDVTNRYIDEVFAGVE